MALEPACAKSKIDFSRSSHLDLLNSLQLASVNGASTKYQIVPKQMQESVRGGSATNSKTVENGGRGMMVRVEGQLA
jgi:hypothetical protein